MISFHSSPTSVQRLKRLSHANVELRGGEVDAFLLAGDQLARAVARSNTPAMDAGIRYVDDDAPAMIVHSLPSSEYSHRYDTDADGMPVTSRYAIRKACASGERRSLFKVQNGRVRPES